MIDGLSEYAIRLAQHVAHTSERGLKDRLSWAELVERFPTEDRARMAEAAFELKQRGLLQLSEGGTADGIAYVRPEYELYWYFDQPAFNYNTAADTVVLIEYLLQDETTGMRGAKALLEAQEWPLRRFNPAFARIVAEFPDERKSQAQSNEPYPAAGVLMTAEERVKLRQLADALRPAPASVDRADDAPTEEAVPPEPKSGKVKLKLPFFEVEYEAPRSVVAALLVFGIGALLFWQWPAIEDRFGWGFERTVPIALAPSDGETLTNFPRTFTMEWEAVPNAVRYVVDIDAADPDTQEYFKHPFESRVTTTQLSVSFEFIGDQPGRWQVTAVDANERSSQPSPWRYFRYESEVPQATVVEEEQPLSLAFSGTNQGSPFVERFVEPLSSGGPIESTLVRQSPAQILAFYRDPTLDLSDVILPPLMSFADIYPESGCAGLEHVTKETFEFPSGKGTDELWRIIRYGSDRLLPNIRRTEYGDAFNHAIIDSTGCGTVGTTLFALRRLYRAGSDDIANAFDAAIKRAPPKSERDHRLIRALFTRRTDPIVNLTLVNESNNAVRVKGLAVEVLERRVSAGGLGSGPLPVVADLLVDLNDAEPGTVRTLAFDPPVNIAEAEALTWRVHFRSDAEFIYELRVRALDLRGDVKADNELIVAFTSAGP